MALKNAGCIEIKFGVETGSNELLAKMHKGGEVTAECAEKAIRLTKSYEIDVKLFIITGLPGETDVTHNETKEFLEKLYQDKQIDRVSLLRYTPLAGSHIYDNPDQFGINSSTLGIDTFQKTRLYRDSYDWWSDSSIMGKCETWYNDMRKFIDERWKDK